MICEHENVIILHMDTHGIRVKHCIDCGKRVF